MSGTDSYRDHYKQYLSVYEEMATVGDGKTSWIPTDQNYGWYVDASIQDKQEHEDEWSAGFSQKSRPRILPDDLDADVERTAYTTIDYALDEAYRTKYWKGSVGDREWFDTESSRLPGYADISAWAVFVDIDIADEYKTRPLLAEHKEIIEGRLQLWVQAFSRMAGDKQAIHLLDSGGGMYVFIPPAGLSPIADEYEPEERGLIFKEVGERIREIVGTLNDLICDQDDAPQELFTADKVQNKNRQFKTVGSIHKTLDSVVYPIDPEDIHIQHKPTAEVTDADISHAHEWATSFTDTRHEQLVQSIIEYVFQGDFTRREDNSLSPVEGDHWMEILDSWLEDKKERIQSWRESQERKSKISEDRLTNEITQDRDVAEAAIDRVNNERLQDYIVSFVGDNNVYQKDGEEMDFYPFWRETSSGRSAFYDYYRGRARFTDKADGTSRNIVYWVALEMSYDDENYPDTDTLLSGPGDDLSAKGYAKSIEELRTRGESIPMYVPEPGDGQLGRRRIIDCGVELGIIPEQDGYNADRQVRPQLWNETLRQLDKRDIEHGREQKVPIERNRITNASGYKNGPFQYGDISNVESRDHVETLLETTPQQVTLFSTTHTIGSAVPDGLCAGVFVQQGTDQITLNRFLPPEMGLETIDRVGDVPRLDEQLSIPKDELVIVLGRDVTVR